MKNGVRLLGTGTGGTGRIFFKLFLRMIRAWSWYLIGVCSTNFGIQNMEFFFDNLPFRPAISMIQRKEVIA